MPTVSPRLRVGAWVAAGVLGGGLVTGLVVSQLGIATAASPSPSPRASGQPRPVMPFGSGRHFGGRLPGLPPFGPGFGPEMGMLGMGPSRVLHGEATVKKPDGTTEVVVS